MKTTGFRSFVLYILIAAFLGGLGFFLIRLCVSGSTWVSQPYNGHIYAEDSTVAAGNITDRNGVVLASTRDGARVYNEDESVRRSFLHTVGDSSGYIGTSVQAIHRSKLMGWNLFTGLNQTLLTELGNDVKLTLDAKTNAAAYNALGGRNGAVFLYNYKTGETLVKVSAPTYDPMNVPGDLMENELYDGVFLDNTLSGVFTPGSIFKLVTAAAALETLPDAQSRTYSCEGVWQLGDSAVTCLDYHGELTLDEALGHSCNIYFAKLAEDVGGKALQETAEAMGFGESFAFDSVSTAKSGIDVGDAGALELAWSAVGQGDVTVNPYHMALLSGAIANGGSTPEPYLTGSAPGTRYTLVKSSTAETLREMMRDTVAYYYGDGMFSGWTLAAKTGTAEIDGKQPTCWITGFSVDESRPYAFALCIEEGDSGLYTAGTALAAILAQLD